MEKLRSISLSSGISFAKSVISVPDVNSSKVERKDRVTENLISMLRNNIASDSICSQALRTVLVMCRRPDNARSSDSGILVNFIKGGLSTILIEIADMHLNSLDVITLVCNLLAFIVGEIRHKNDILVHRTFDVMVKILRTHSTDPTVVIDGCKIVHYLCKISVDIPVGLQDKPSEDFSNLSSAGSCEVLINLLLIHSTNSKVLIWICGAIHSMCFTPLNKQQLCALGLGNLLVNILSNNANKDDEFLVESVWTVLISLSANKDHHVQLRDGGILTVLHSSIHTKIYFNNRILILTLTCLQNMITDTTSRDILMLNGISEGLIRSLLSHATQPDIITSIYPIIQTFIIDSTTSARTFVRNGLCDALSTVLRENLTNTHIAHIVCTLIIAMSIDTANVPRMRSAGMKRHLKVILKTSLLSSEQRLTVVSAFIHISSWKSRTAGRLRIMPYGII
eukprot:gene2699-5316_t